MAADLVRRLEKVGALAQSAPTAADVRAARALWADVRADLGLRGDYHAPMLTPADGNYKLDKNDLPTVSLALLPADGSGWNVCRYSTPECRRGCVAYSGHGEMARTIRVRAARTEFLARDPHAFLALVEHEIGNAVRRHGEIAVRLNAFSDIPWHRLAPGLFARFPSVQFYDYTKWSDHGPMPSNYHLTFSASERTSTEDIRARVESGQNVAVVLGVKRKADLPETWEGLPVHDGDQDDARWEDPRGVVVGLRAKGRMRTGEWGYVRSVS